MWERTLHNVYNTTAHSKDLFLFSLSSPKAPGDSELAFGRDLRTESYRMVTES